MATQTDTVHSLVPGWLPFAGLRLRVARHRCYRRLHAAFDGMTDAELERLGVDRRQIGIIARAGAARIR
jgi:hypothetical protein